MKGRWSLGSYSRFIKAARSREGLSLPQARILYRRMKDRLDRPVYAADLKKKQIRSTAHTEAALIRQSSNKYIPEVSRSYSEMAGDSGAEFAASHIDAGHMIDNLEDWEAIYEEWDFDYDDETYEGTASYKSDEA